MRNKLHRTKQRLAAHRQRLQQLPNHPFALPVALFVMGFLFVGVIFVFLGGQNVSPSDRHVVRLYLDGQAKVLPTRAETVGDLLGRLNVHINEHDIVQPDTDAVITEDNFKIKINRVQPVTIVDAGKPPATTFTAQDKPQEIIKQAGVQVYPEDKIAVQPPTEALKEGIIGPKVVIDRATPVKLNLYGTTYEVRTHAATVQALMQERNIAFNQNSVFPEVSHPIKANDVIFVTQPGKHIAVQEEAIAAPVNTVIDPNVLAGQTQVANPGAPGRKVVIYEIAANGKKVPLQQVIVSEPVAKVVAKGTKIINVAIGGDKSAVLSAAGVPLSQQYAADFVISRESGWRLTARNAGGCIGLGQACPGSKLMSACPNWQTDATCQIKFFTAYANGKYGSWEGAYRAWQVKHWW